MTSRSFIGRGGRSGTERIRVRFICFLRSLAPHLQAKHSHSSKSIPLRIIVTHFSLGARCEYLLLAACGKGKAFCVARGRIRAPAALRRTERKLCCEQAHQRPATLYLRTNSFRCPKIISYGYQIFDRLFSRLVC